MQTAIFLKNQHIFAEFGRLLLVGELSAPLAQSVDASAVLWGDHYPPSDPGYMPPKLDDIDAVVIMLPKSRALLARLLHELGHCYQAKPCFLIGAKTEGIAGAARQFSQFCKGAYKLDSARHCQLWQATLPAVDDYQVTDFCTFFSYQVADCHMQLCTLAGVFNHGGIDAGTQLLLNYLASAALVTGRRALDFGCGSGVLGIYLKLQNAATSVDLCDISRAAIYSSQVSAALNHVEVNTILADGIGALNAAYDLIISNPPFHTGVAVNERISAEFFKNAKQKLVSNGQLIIVANKFLQYQPQLQHIFGNCKVLCSNAKFIVLQAKKNCL